MTQQTKFTNNKKTAKHVVMEFDCDASHIQSSSDKVRGGGGFGFGII